MADPTATTTAAAWAVTAGLMSAFFAAIGVTWEAVFYATLGALAGSGVHAPIGRIKAIAVFPVAVLLSAKGGLSAGAWLGAVGGLTGIGLAEMLASGIALIFHPLAATAVRLVPALAAKHLGVNTTTANPPPESRP